MRGISDDSMSDLPLDKDFHFFNPKAGLTYQNRGHLLAGSFAIANREPSRANYTENILFDPATKTYLGKMPEAERLYDYELGYTYAHTRFNIGVNLYFMDYDNQLVLTGRVNDVGKQSTTNVKDSYRMGMELSAGVKITDWFRWEGNFVLSRNKILNYEQKVDIYDENYEWVRQDTWFFKETTIAFSPMITAMSLFTFDYKGLTAAIQTNVTSKQYLDNTMHESASLKAFTTTNLNVQYTLPIRQWSKARYLPEVRLLCQVNNMFNAKYANNGGADASYMEDGTHPWPWYFAQAGINVHGGFVVNF
jgi:iron complex outermembrane receptor protein